MRNLIKIVIFSIVLLAFSSCLGIGAFEAPLDNYCYKPEFEPRTYVWPFVRKQQPPIRTYRIKPDPPRPQGGLGKSRGGPNRNGRTRSRTR
jgi:hypothetical protein